MRSLVAVWMRSAAAVARPALLGVAALSLATVASRAQDAPPPSSRVALVIGEGLYRAGPLPAAPDDAGLVAQVLAGAGFDVTGARDLDGDGLRRAFRDFLDRAGAAGPDGIAVVYFAGRAVQADGDNFLVPVDARLARPSDVPIEALRLADFTHALAALPIQARVVVVDGAYAGGPASGGPAALDSGAIASPAGAPGLALVDAEQGELLAFNAAPGTVAPATPGPYGAYAQALVAAVKQGGVPVDEVFDRVRLAVNGATGGAVVPWDSDRLTRSFAFFDRAPGAPAVASAQIPFATLEKRPLRDFPPDQAYDLAVARDTLPAYAEFLAAFPDSPLARRVRLIQAVRREALFWRAAVLNGTPGAYWTYLAHYPRGPHAGDARRRLSRLSAAAAPPPRFAPIGFDVPPPPPDEIVVDRSLLFDAPDLPPPPLPPVFLLPPPVVVVLERPAPPTGPAFLPVPVPVAIPFVRAPVDPGVIAPPRGVRGDYPRPRPFARGPNGDGLVVQSAPQPASSAPSPGPAGVWLSAPPAAPSGPGGRPAEIHQPMMPSVPPVVPSVPPGPRTPVAPRAPALPAGSTLPMPSTPTVPTSPAAPIAPPASPPPSHPQPQKGHPASVAPAGPIASPPAADLPQPPRAVPAKGAAPARKPVHPSAAPSPPPAVPMTPPHPAPTSRPVAPVPPASVPKPAAPPPAATEPAPARSAPAPHPPTPSRPPAPERQPPHPSAPDRPGPGALPAPGPAAGHPPGGPHPGCGHPGAPPCHP